MKVTIKKEKVNPFLEEEASEEELPDGLEDFNIYSDDEEEDEVEDPLPWEDLLPVANKQKTPAPNNASKRKANFVVIESEEEEEEEQPASLSKPFTINRRLKKNAAAASAAIAAVAAKRAKNAQSAASNKRTTTVSEGKATSAKRNRRMSVKLASSHLQ